MNTKRFLALIIVIALNLLLIFNSFAEGNGFKNDLLDVSLKKGFGNSLTVNLFLNSYNYFKPVISYREPNEYVIILPETVNKTLNRPNTLKIKVIDSYDISQSYYTNSDNKNGYVKISIKTKKKVALNVKQIEGKPKQNSINDIFSKWLFIVVGLLVLLVVSIFMKNRKINASVPVGLNSLNNVTDPSSQKNYVTPDEFLSTEPIIEEPEEEQNIVEEEKLNFEETLIETKEETQELPKPIIEEFLIGETEEIEEETEPEVASEEDVEDVLALLDDDDEDDLSIEDYTEDALPDEESGKIEYEETQEDLQQEEPSFDSITFEEPVKNEEPTIIEPESIEPVEEVSLEITEEPTAEEEILPEEIVLSDTVLEEPIEEPIEIIEEEPIEIVEDEDNQEELVEIIEETPIIEEEITVLDLNEPIIEEPVEIIKESVVEEIIPTPIIPTEPEVEKPSTPIQEPIEIVEEEEEEDSFFNRINQAYKVIENTPPLTPKPEVQEEEKILPLNEETVDFQPIIEPIVEEEPEIILAIEENVVPPVEPTEIIEEVPFVEPEEEINEEPVEIIEEPIVEEVVLFEQEVEEVKNSDEPDILAEKNIGENKSLYIVNMDDEFSLIGIINDEPFVLHKFDKKPIDNNIYVKLNEVKGDNKIYLIQVAKWRALISVNDESMEFILAL